MMLTMVLARSRVQASKQMEMSMAIHTMHDGSKVITTNIFPPIPDRRFDWCAYFDGDEPNDNGSMMQGFGATESEAIDDLIRLYEEKCECEMSDEEYDRQAQKWDHDRDLRKHG